MALEGRKQQKQVQPRAAALRRSFAAYRQLDLFQVEPAANALNPYARHLQRMRAMRDQEPRA